MKDSWKSSDAYENFMGRWSRHVAKSFLKWLSPSTGQKWLDVGCGSGALSEAIINEYKPARLIAIDQSIEFVTDVQKRLGQLLHCQVGNALALPVEDASVDITVSGLVLNFISDPIKALNEMKRVTTSNGTIAVYIWDYAGIMEFLTRFWDAAVRLDPRAFKLHESHRFPDSHAESLTEQFHKAGIVNIETAPIEINTFFENFDDYWNSFLGGQGPAPTFLHTLNEIERRRLRNMLFEELPIQPDGSIPLVARAWGAKGKFNQEGNVRY